MRKQQIPLDERLALCASFVREGTSLADVGTDHVIAPFLYDGNNAFHSWNYCVYY